MAFILNVCNKVPENNHLTCLPIKFNYVVARGSFVLIFSVQLTNPP